jgi:hypothetical protein
MIVLVDASHKESHKVDAGHVSGKSTNETSHGSFFDILHKIVHAPGDLAKTAVAKIIDKCKAKDTDDEEKPLTITDVGCAMLLPFYLGAVIYEMGIGNYHPVIM